LAQVVGDKNRFPKRQLEMPELRQKKRTRQITEAGSQYETDHSTHISFAGTLPGIIFRVADSFAPHLHSNRDNLCPNYFGVMDG